MVEEIMKDTDIEQLLAEFESVGQDVVAIRQWVDHGNGKFGRNRRQALEEFPMLVMPLFRLSSKPIYREIEWAIDWGYSLVDAWSRGIGVKKESVRYLGRKGPALVGSDWLTDPARLLHAVDLVPSGKRPRVRYEWELFRALWEGCLNYHNDPNYQTDFSPSEPRQHQMEKFFIELCSGGYDAFDRLLEKLWQGNPDRLRDVSDYFSFVRSWCATGTDLGYINEHVSNAAYGTIADEFLMKYSATELIRQSERWHRVMEQISPVIEEALDQHSELHAWPDLPGFPFSFHRHTVVLLTNANQLLVEGRRLLHCVGGYVNSCVLGKSHILSIRDCAGTSLSTAEIARGFKFEVQL